MTTYSADTGGEVCERPLSLHLVLGLESTGPDSWEGKLDMKLAEQGQTNPCLSLTVPNLNDVKTCKEKQAPFACSCTHLWSRTLGDVRRGFPAGAGGAVGLGAMPPQQGGLADQ